jgi:hypothetical protein
MVAAIRRSRKTPNNNVATKNDKNTNTYRSDDGFGIVSHYSSLGSKAPLKPNVAEELSVGLH